RLLNTPIIGPWPAMVASSWIDMLAGLSKKKTFRMPPCFCADAGAAPHSISTRTGMRMRFLWANASSHATGQHLVRLDPSLTMLNTPSSRWGLCALLLGPHASDSAVKNRHVGSIEVCSEPLRLNKLSFRTSRARRDRVANHQGENSESVPTRSVSAAGAVPRLLAAKNRRWGRDGPDLYGGHGVSPSIAHGERQKCKHPLVGSTRGSTPCATDSFLSCRRPRDHKTKPFHRIFQSIALASWCPAVNWTVTCRLGASSRLGNPGVSFTPYRNLTERGYQHREPDPSYATARATVV